MPPQDAAGKRVAPISASAFSFSIASPARPARPAKKARTASPKPPPRAAKQTPRAKVTTSGALPLPAAPSLSFSSPGPSRRAPPPPPPHRNETPKPVRTLTANAASTTSHSPLRPVTAITTPIARKTQPRTRLDALPSPFALVQRTTAKDGSPGPSSRSSRPLNALLDASPFRVGPSVGVGGKGKGKAKEETPRPLQSITTSAPPRVELRQLERERVLDTEEGIGVSPRKNKGAIQHKGPGPPPSVRLATLLSSSSTSLVLFYTSLQHTLSRMPPGAGATSTPLRASAPVRIHVLSALTGPTHSCTIVRGRVSLWPAQQACPADTTLLVVLQVLPSDCPRVGVDPRVLLSSNKRYELGIWQPWSENTVPGEEGGEDIVLFASRYLIAEAPGP